MEITRHTVTTLDYKLTNDSGEVLDTSEGREPLMYVHGTGTLIPGLEKELEGKSSGDAFEVRIPAAEAYGERDDKLIQEVPRDRLPAEADIQVGMQFQARTEDGMHILTVLAIDGDSVKMDANHPLAGVALTFNVTVVDVRAAQPEEIEHGHAHRPGEGGH